MLARVLKLIELGAAALIEQKLRAKVGVLRDEPQACSTEFQFGNQTGIDGVGEILAIEHRAAVVLVDASLAPAQICGVDAQLEALAGAQIDASGDLLFVEAAAAGAQLIGIQAVGIAAMPAGGQGGAAGPPACPGAAAQIE